MALRQRTRVISFFSLTHTLYLSFSLRVSLALPVGPFAGGPPFFGAACFALPSVVVLNQKVLARHTYIGGTVASHPSPAATLAYCQNLYPLPPYFPLVWGAVPLVISVPASACSFRTPRTLEREGRGGR